MLLEYVGITNLKERNMSCTSTGLQLAFFPLSAPMAASKTPKHHTRRRSEKKKRKHCTSHDVLSILAMLHFGGKGDYELMLSFAISL